MSLPLHLGANTLHTTVLLEAMAEGAVSSDGEVWQLPRPFLIIAIQDLIETYGTFPLPSLGAIRRSFFCYP